MNELTSHPAAAPVWVSAAVLRAVQSALEAQNVELERDGRLPPLPTAPDAQISWDECMRRLSVALELSGQPALGLYAGERATIAALHLVGHVLISCPSLRMAGQAFLRFAPLVISGATFSLREDRDEALFSFAPPACSGDAQRFCAEIALTIAHGVISLFPTANAHGSAVTQVRFKHAAPGYAAEYARVFRCDVHCGASENAIVLSRATLDLPYHYGDDALRTLLATRAERMLEERAAGTSLATRVRHLLLTGRLDDADVDSIARRLAVPPWVLRRRLSQEGTNFSALLDEVRRERAMTALAEPDVCIKALSEDLGFSEPCAFHRAFRRWTSTTPARYRATLRSGVITPVSGMPVLRASRA
jgi:AraC-like DNA-binding protein